MNDPIPPLKTLLWRGARKKCPQCGCGVLFKRWTTLNENCSACGLKLLENEGDLWGYLVIVDRLLFLFPLIAVIYFQINQPDSVWMYIVGIGLALALVLTLPHRTGMSVAFDYMIRRKSGDLAGNG